MREICVKYISKEKSRKNHTEIGLILDKKSLFFQKFAENISAEIFPPKISLPNILGFNQGVQIKDTNN